MKTTFYFIFLLTITLSLESDSEILNLNTTNFENIIENSKKAILVLFFDPKCPHSEKFIPSFKKIAKEYEDNNNIAFGMINGEENVDITDRNFVLSYPKMKLFVNGESYFFEGKRSEERIKDFINEYISKSKSQLKYAKNLRQQ